MRIKYFSFAVDIDCQKNFMENSDVILCSLCSVWREERRKKQKKNPKQNSVISFEWETQVLYESVCVTAGSFSDGSIWNCPHVELQSASVIN